jgi:hypothetical protein
MQGTTPPADIVPPATPPAATPETPSVAAVAQEVKTADATAVAQKVVQQAKTIQELQDQLKTAQSSSPAAAPPVAPTLASVKEMPALPAPKVVAEKDMQAYAMTMQVLEHHAIQDTEFPLLFEALAIPANTVAKVVGPTMWLQFFPKDPPMATTPIPRRLLGALNVNMARLAICSESYAAVSQEKVKQAVDGSALAYNKHQEQANGQAGQHY